MEDESQLRTHLIILALFTVLTLLLTYPLIFRLNTHLIGDDSDVWINPWADWWLRKALKEGKPLYFTDYLFYPQGVSLVFHSFSPLNTLLGWPLKPVVGRNASYNLTILFAYIFSGYGMWRLARYWTGNSYAGLLAGVVFAFFPYHMIESAHPVIVTTQWMPLCALYLIRALRERRVRHGYLAAFFLVLSVLSGWHIFNFMILWASLYLIYMIFFQKAIGLGESLKVLLMPSLILLLVLLPLIYPLLRDFLSAGTYMSVSTYAGRGNHPWSFFIPTQYHPIFGKVFAGANQLIGRSAARPAFVGYAVLLMSLHAGLKGGKRTRFWALALLVFTLLSLEPMIPVRFGEYWRVPWATPVVALFRHPFRFNILISFCLSILVACDLSSLLQGVRSFIGQRKAKVSLTGLLVMLILFEYLVLPFPTTHPENSPFYYDLGEREDDFAIAEIPIGRQADKFSMYYQVVHQKRIVGGVVSRTPAGVYSYIKNNSLLEAAWHQSPTSLSPQDAEMAFRHLEEDNIRYVILKKYLMEDSTLNDWRALLSEGKVYEDDLLVVYSTMK
jgi:hypothetical protein